jgi:hypothetical protein
LHPRRIAGKKEEALVTKAHALVMTAESVQGFATDQQHGDVFRKDLTTVEEIIHTVPIIAAIHSHNALPPFGIFCYNV